MGVGWGSGIRGKWGEVVGGENECSLRDGGGGGGWSEGIKGEEERDWFLPGYNPPPPPPPPLKCL